MERELLKSLYTIAIGAQTVEFLEQLDPGRLVEAAESQAMKLLWDIKAILDDEALDDPACFHRIEAVVRAFEARDIQINRHDW